mmetsp:Transcript_67680/g.188847  ORF Transcript_67680/g.188847 Transcript_67680/m.188847 type:complete len:210 (+) Transcript_67680:294-923(+)
MLIARRSRRRLSGRTSAKSTNLRSAWLPRSASEVWPRCRPTTNAAPGSSSWRPARSSRRETDSSTRCSCTCRTSETHTKRPSNARQMLGSCWPQGRRSSRCCASSARIRLTSPRSPAQRLERCHARVGGLSTKWIRALREDSRPWRHASRGCSCRRRTTRIASFKRSATSAGALARPRRGFLRPRSCITQPSGICWRRRATGTVRQRFP